MRVIVSICGFLRTIRMIKMIKGNWFLIWIVKFLFKGLDLFEVVFGVGLENGDVSFMEFQGGPESIILEFGFSV